jgi:hypothetical protein
MLPVPQTWRVPRTTGEDSEIPVATPTNEGLIRRGVQTQGDSVNMLRAAHKPFAITRRRGK